MMKNMNLKTRLLVQLTALLSVIALVAPVTVTPLTTESTAVAGVLGTVIIGAVAILVTVNLLPTIAVQAGIAKNATATDAKTDSLIDLLPFGLGLLAFVGLFSSFI